MSDNRIITQLQLVEEDGGATAVTAITENHKMVPLFSYYPDWISIEEQELVGRSVGWARGHFVAKMQKARVPDA